MQTNKTIAIISILSVLAASALYGGQDVYLSLSAKGDRTDVGLCGFNPATPSEEEIKLGKQIFETLRYDLIFSRYFNLITDGPAFTGTDKVYADWDALGADMLVAGELKTGDNGMVLACKLIDIESKEIMWKKEFRASKRDARELAHQLNDEIVYRFTGERGIAHTRIAFANRKIPAKEICIIDYDGHNMRKLTEGGSINMFPRWSPDGKEIIFTTFMYGNPDLYSVSPAGGNLKSVSRRQGLNATGSFTTDGQRLAVTLSLGKDPSLYLLERSGKMARQLTFDRGIETSPCFSPNGKELVFISDKPGIPQLYIMGLEGGNMRRLPAKGYCDSPAWSPRGDRIVFTMRQGRGKYDLYIYELATENVARLTQDNGTNENPTWSPDGRFIVFSSNRSGRSELYIIGADGSGARKLGEIAGDSTMPSWGP